MPITPRQTDPNAAAHERLYRTLRQQVMHGELPPGQAMTLRGLGKQFGVSMTPAREAVRRAPALIVNDPKGGTDSGRGTRAFTTTVLRPTETLPAMSTAHTL